MGSLIGTDNVLGVWRKGLRNCDQVLIVCVFSFDGKRSAQPHDCDAVATSEKKQVEIFWKK